MRILIIINSIIGLWLAGMWAVVFYFMLQGSRIYEPNQTIARTELVVAIVLAIGFLLQFVYFFWLELRRN